MLAPLLVLQIPLTLVQFCLFPNEAAASLSVTPKLLGRKYYEDYSVFQPGFFYFFFFYFFFSLFFLHFFCSNRYFPLFQVAPDPVFFPLAPQPTNPLRLQVDDRRIYIGSQWAE